MTPRTNLTVCRGFFQRMINEGNLAMAPALFAADSVHHELGDVAPEYKSGPRAMAEFVDLYRRAFPDLHLTIEDEVAAGDSVVTRFRLEGTQTGSLMAIQASGRTINVEGIRIDRLENGKITESWMQLDMLALLEQIGALPALCRQPAAARAPEYAAAPYAGAVARNAPMPAYAA